MPELPEVETIMHGLNPLIEGAIIKDVVLRHHQLRWPIPPALQEHLSQRKIGRLLRRGKYLGSVGFLVDLELNASKGYHVGMIYNRRVQYGRTTNTFRHPGLRNNIASC